MKIEKHQLVATGVFVASSFCFFYLYESFLAIEKSVLLFAALLPILLYKFLAWMSGFGFFEAFARDYGTENSPGPYAFFFWVLFIVVWLFLIFDWSLY
ncbi:MAG: hypothetical protein L3J24_05435 [Xanthomonadales bacterium]|nr:hypothetical protein [Xanthomonadales bacterium]